MFWKMIFFPKKSHWNMIFLVVLSGKMIFPFPENMILFVRQKMKENLSQKNTWKYNIFFKCPEKMVIQKKKSRWNMILLELSGKMVSFSWKISCFFIGRKMKNDLSQETHGNMIFSVYMYKCYKYDVTLLQKRSKMIFFRKNTLKGDWHSRSHSRKSSNDSLYFYGDLHRRFHILLSSEKKWGNLIYRIEIWLLLQFIWLEIFYNEESSILCTIQPSEVVFRGVLEHQLRKLFVH